jgi:hypothetical protein
MSAPHSKDRSERARLLDLLADEAIFGLTRAERDELDSLLARHRDVPRDAALATVVAIEDAFLDPAEEALSPELRAKLARQGREWPLHGAGGKPISRRLRSAAYVLAAAILIAGFAVMYRGSRRPDHGDAAADYAALAASPDVVRWPFVPGGDATATAASGEVLWSTADQRGYLRLSGLERNDPRENQYQLWIFDRGRDERYPVDGGVFDVEAAAGAETLVRIDAPLKVLDPVLFAVTVEAPGGVVVSSRERIAVLAKP